MRFGGETVADTRGAHVLRQHGFLPVFYLPLADVRQDLLEPSDWTTESPYRGTATYWHLRAGDRVAESAVWTYREPRAGSPDTRGYCSFDFHSMDAWYEEEERIYVHARDPYLRADARRSSRHVVVEVGGVAGRRVAAARCCSTRPGLITRYYLPLADVRRELLEPSETFTECPYKGRCDYWSVRAPGRRARTPTPPGATRQPLPDVGAIAGHLCFWQEREDTVLRIDGEVLPRPLGDARRRRRRGAAAVARPPRHAAAGEHAGRCRPARCSATARARTTAPRARRTASWTWRTSAPAARGSGATGRDAQPRYAARRSKLSVMPSFMPVSSAASRARLRRVDDGAGDRRAVVVLARTRRR